MPSADVRVVCAKLLADLWPASSPLSRPSGLAPAYRLGDGRWICSYCGEEVYVGE